MSKTKYIAPLDQSVPQAHLLQRQQWQQNFSAATHLSISRGRKEGGVLWLAAVKNGRRKVEGLQNPLNPSHSSSYDKKIYIPLQYK